MAWTVGILDDRCHLLEKLSHPLSAALCIYALELTCQAMLQSLNSTRCRVFKLLNLLPNGREEGMMGVSAP